MSVRSRDTRHSVAGATSLVLAVLALTVLVLAGCGNVSDTDNPLVSQVTDAPVAATVLVSDPTDGSMDALGGGRLEVVGGCLGANGSVIVWPLGTEVVKSDPLTIMIPDNGTYSIGDTVEVGGGYIHESPQGGGPGPATVGSTRVPISCSGHKIFLAGPNPS